jgi:hypothetical protein
MPEGGGDDAGGVVGGCCAGVVDALGVGAGDEDGLVTGVEDALGVGVGETATFGARLAVAVGDGCDDADGPDSALGDDAGSDGELPGHPEVPLAAASASVPDVTQPSSVM